MKPKLPCIDLGCTTSIEVITGCLSLGNKRVIDAGCGSITAKLPGSWQAGCHLNPISGSASILCCRAGRRQVGRGIP